MADRLFDKQKAPYKGEILFSLYTNNPEATSNLDEATIEMYADDTTLCCSSDSVDSAVMATNN